jgi:hypothetical protein
MADEIGKVSFGVEANFDDKGMKDAERGLGQLTRAAGVAANGISGFGVAVGTASGILAVDLVKGIARATVAVAGFAFSVTRSASDAVEGMQRIADATGLSLRELQQFEPVMRKNGVRAEELGTLFRALSRNIYEARDSSSQAGQAFAQLGLVMTGLESPSEVLSLIADRVSKLPDGFEKTRLVTELLGRSGIKLTSTLNQGAEGFRQSAIEAAKMANVLSEQSNKALLDVNDTFDMLALASDNLDKHLAVLFAPMVKGVNEARLALNNLAATITDDITIATRTLYVRLESLFGFLKEQAALSIFEIGKVPEIFRKWDEAAAAQIKAIRKQGVAVQELGKTIGTVDEKAQALAKTQADAWIQSKMGLMQLDEGWKIAQREIDAYGKAQKALGEYIATQGVQAYKDLQQASELWAQSDLEATTRNIEQFKAMEAQQQATAEAMSRAALASGAISPVEFESRSGEAALAAIDREIRAQQERLTALTTFYDKKLTLAANDANAQRELIQQHIAAEADANNKILLLTEQRRTQEVAIASAVSQAEIRASQAQLAARESIAQAELSILQSTFASTEQLRTARMAAIEASLARELAAVGLTEEQKLAIYRRTEAERIAVARQFPTFFEKQLQDLVASNTFSMSQIVTGFTNATAQMIVTGKGFQQFWQQLQVTVVQAFLNGLIQMVANYMLKLTAMETLTAAFEAAKTAIFGSGEAARLAVAAATNKALLASTTTTLVAMGAVGNATLAVLEVALQGIAGFLYAVAAAVAEVPIVGQALAGALIVGATLAEFTGNAAIVAAGATLNTALGTAIVAATTALASPFASGGIVTSPTLSLIGEAGSSEAIIPLNKQGAGFMAEMLSLGGKQGREMASQTIIIQLDGREISRSVSREMPSVLRLGQVPA